MKWLDRSLLASLALALAGCSDDGLAPPADTDPATSGATSSASSPGSDSDPNSGPLEGTDGQGGSSGPEGDSTSGAGTTTGDGESDGDDGSETGTAPGGMCEGPDECVVINDCCQCAAAHVDDEVPACPMECLQPMCDALGIPDIEAVCTDGGCELEPVDCSPGLVVCDMEPPRCPEGTLPEVTPDGDCWTGACVPEDACDGVPSCDACDEGEACVQVVTMLGSLYSCQDLPDDCGGVPTCACLPPDTCMAPYDTCEDGDAGDGMITCSCPAC